MTTFCRRRLASVAVVPSLRRGGWLDLASKTEKVLTSKKNRALRRPNRSRSKKSNGPALSRRVSVRHPSLRPARRSHAVHRASSLGGRSFEFVPLSEAAEYSDQDSSWITEPKKIDGADLLCAPNASERKSDMRKKFPALAPRDECLDVFVRLGVRERSRRKPTAQPILRVRAVGSDRTPGAPRQSISRQLVRKDNCIRGFVPPRLASNLATGPAPQPFWRNVRVFKTIAIPDDVGILSEKAQSKWENKRVASDKGAGMGKPKGGKFDRYGGICLPPLPPFRWNAIDGLRPHEKRRINRNAQMGELARNTGFVDAEPGDRDMARPEVCHQSKGAVGCIRGNSCRYARNDL